jgi:hypothetical protein
MRWISTGAEGRARVGVSGDVALAELALQKTLGLY